MPWAVKSFTSPNRTIYVVVLEDMIAARAESDSQEPEQGEFYKKYDDKRFWRYLGLDLSLQKSGRKIVANKVH